MAIELARHGIDVVGVDVDASMLATARDARARGRVGRGRPARRSTSAARFDVVVMAGNVPLFTPPGTQADARGRGRAATSRPAAC